MKRLTISIPTKMYERFKYEARNGGGGMTVRQYVEWKLKFWEGHWTDMQGECEKNSGTSEP